MAGRRFIDAAKLYKASRSIVSHHIDIRRQQLDVFTRTSTLAKAVKNQTDRVTLTAQAAIALSRTLNGTDSRTAYSTSASEQQQDTPIFRRETIDDTNAPRSQEEGIQQDHHYDASEQNAAAQPPPKQELGIKQEKADTYPLPDGSIPPADSSAAVRGSGQDTYAERPVAEPPKEPLVEEKSQQEDGLQPAASDESTIPVPERKPLSADEARHLQRQSESQIPSASAGTQPSQTTLSQGHDEDVFYGRSTTVTPSESSLPRAKIPKHTETTQGSDERVEDSKINADVFYSSGAKEDKVQIPKQEAVPEQESIPDDINTDVFHSPRIARMLGGGVQKGPYSSGLKMEAATKTPIDNTKLSEGHDQDTFNVRRSESTTPASPKATASTPENDNGPGLNTSSQDANAMPTTSSSANNSPKIPTTDNGPALNTSSQDPNAMPTTDTSEKSRDEEDMRKLAEDMAKDAATTSPLQPEMASQIAASPSKPAYEMRESSVPSTRFGRFWQYASLGTSMAFGAVGESLKRATGTASVAGGSLMLSPANIERLVAKLSRMRGAALKLGQMISIQDMKMLPAPIHDVLQRVQDSADYMPASQRNRVLTQNLGADWRDLFSTFDEIPIAAASIGQVHRAVLASSGKEVAVKVQYPGVANSIDSDLNNLSILLTASRLLPKGLYLDKTIANARTELAWECDYIREAECATRFRELVADDSEIFTVPAIIPEASGKTVLTAELMHGKAVTKLPHLTQEQRDWIGTQILRLSLREITEFKFMQTDPNWTNFLYNEQNNKLELLDFGASREYPDHFITPYIGTLVAASRGDRDRVAKLSIELGYLTGAESKTMLNAHIESVLTLSEPFGKSASEVYDFRDQTITDRVRELIPVMVRERLSPPPEETYSLHRKLSGAFLLCARLGSRIMCREMFEKAVGTWERSNKI